MTLTTNPSCIGTFNAASAFGISTHTPFKFAPAIDCYSQAAGSGVFSGFAAPQNSLFPSTGPFSISSDRRRVKQASHIGLHVLSLLKPPTFIPLHAHAFVAGASEYISAPHEPTEKMEAAGNDTKDLSHWIEDLSIPDMVVRCEAIEALGKIVPDLDPAGRLGPALKIVEMLEDEIKGKHESHTDCVHRYAIEALGKIVPHLNSGDRLGPALKIAERLWKEKEEYVRERAIEALDNIMPHLDSAERLTLADELALNIDRQVNPYDTSSRAHPETMFGKIVPHLDPGVGLELALKIAERLWDGDARAAVSALEIVVSHLDRADILTLAHKVEERLNIENEYRDVLIEVLGNIVPHLDPGVGLKLALKIAERLGDEDKEVRRVAVGTLGNIVPHLDPGVGLKLALKIAERLEDEDGRVRQTAIWVIRDVVPHLDPRDRLEPALKIAESLEDRVEEHVREFAISALEVNLRNLPPGDYIKLARKIMPHLDPADRKKIALHLKKK